MRGRRRQRQAGAVAAKGGLSAKSMIRAKSIAASILNMSENDLADIMDTDQVGVSVPYKHEIEALYPLTIVSRTLTCL